MKKEKKVVLNINGKDRVSNCIGCFNYQYLADLCKINGKECCALKQCPIKRW